MDIFSLKKLTTRLTQSVALFTRKILPVLLKKKVIVLFSVLLGLGMVTYIFVSINTVNSLFKSNDYDSLELFILKQSLAVFKNNKEKDHQEIIALKNRVNNIIGLGEDSVPTSISQTPSNTTVISNNTSAPKPTPLSSMSQQQTTAQSNSTTPSSDAPIGNLETYSSSGHKINIYKEPTTISTSSTVENGKIVPYFKKETDWYLIKPDADSDNLWWINTMNIRGVQ